MKTLLCATAVALAAITAPAAADDGSPAPLKWALWKQVGEWTVEGSNLGCRALTGYPNGAELGISMMLDGTVTLYLGNPRWANRFVEDGEYTIGVQLDNSRVETFYAIGIGGGHVMMPSLSSSGITGFALARGIHFYNSGVPLGGYNLPKSKQATLEVGSCVDAIRQASGV